LAAEFNWSERTAENFMRAYDLHCKSEKFADLDLPVSAFYLLAAPSTPDKALEEVAMRVGKGNGVSVAEVKDIIAKSRRGSSLRHLIHVARQTLRDLIKRGLPAMLLLPLGGSYMSQFCWQVIWAVRCCRTRPSGSGEFTAAGFLASIQSHIDAPSNRCDRL
jgi:hypothetical protein